MVLLRAAGEPIVETGKAMLEVQLRILKLTQELVVAEIKDDYLLEADILQNDNEGQGDLCLSEEILRLKGTEVLLIGIGKPRKSVRK